MNTPENRLEKMKVFFTSLVSQNNLDIDLPYFAESDHQSFEDLKEAIENNNGFDCEVIYYSTAIEYLKENDNSLRQSLEIASDMGFELKNLNSEILASLLKSQNERENFEDLESEIETFFEELNSEDEEEETEEA